MDQKRCVFVVYCVVCSIATLCMIMVIALIVEGRFDFTENSKSLSDIDYNVNRYSDNMPESGWNMNGVNHLKRHDKFSNKVYSGKGDENYLIIDDENFSQIDHDKRYKVKEVIFPYKTTDVTVA